MQLSLARLLVINYQPTHQDILDAAGEGGERREMIQSMLDDENGIDDDNGGKRAVRSDSRQCGFDCHHHQGSCVIEKNRPRELGQRHTMGRAEAGLH